MSKLTPAQLAARLADRKTISINQAHEVTYWSKKFGVSKSVLIGAVEKVGNKVVDISRELAAAPAPQQVPTKPNPKGA
mgnify:CR=1 FL=1